MNKILKLFTIISIAVFFASCSASHAGLMYPSGVLTTNNFNYVKQGVKGASSVSYAFGIFGGTKTATLVDDAKKQLLTANPLGPNQALVNLTVNFQYKNCFPLGLIKRKTTCTIVADIVEFK